MFVDTSPDVQQNTAEDPQLAPWFLEVEHFLLNKVLPLLHNFSARQCFLTPLDLKSMKTGHAAFLRCCCRIVRSSSRPMVAPASLPLALNTMILCCFFSNCTVTIPCAASLLPFYSLALTKQQSSQAFQQALRPPFQRIKTLIIPLLKIF